MTERRARRIADPPLRGLRAAILLLSSPWAMPSADPSSVLPAPLPPPPDAAAGTEVLAAEVPAEAPSAVCASCGTPLEGPYCHACGEKRLDRHDYALAHVVEHGIDAFTHFDLKVLRSLWSLFRRPGLMAADVLAGRRVQWTRPFQLFIVANVLYFVLASWLGINTFQTPLRYHLSSWYGDLAQTVATGKAAYLGLTAEAYAERFDHQAHVLSKSLLIALVPFVALVLAVLFRRPRRYVLEHLTVALVLVPALLLLMPLPLPFALAMMHLVPQQATGDLWWTMGTGLLFGAYASVFFRQAYGGSWRVSVLRAIVFVWLWYLILLYVYRPFLFLVAQVLTGS